MEKLKIGSIKRKRELYMLGVLSLIEKVGGIDEMRNQIAEAHKRGELTGGEERSLRSAVNEAINYEEANIRWEKIPRLS